MFAFKFNLRRYNEGAGVDGQSCMFGSVFEAGPALATAPCCSPRHSPHVNLLVF
jgi:hypothetical protein